MCEIANLKIWVQIPFQPYVYERMAEWLKAADCKSVGSPT